MKIPQFTDFWHSGDMSPSRKRKPTSPRLSKKRADNTRAEKLAAELSHKSPRKLHKKRGKRKSKR